MEHWSWIYIERPRRIIESIVNKLFRMNNEKLIQRDVNKHRNELVYDSPFSVVRLLGWTDIPDDDYFWVVYDSSQGVVLHSCVGGYVWLKDRLSIFEYHYADDIFKLNTPPLSEILQLVKDMNIILK